MRRTKARSEWSYLSKKIQSKLRNFPVKSTLKTLHCSFTTSSSSREMSFNTTTAPIFFSSFPSLWPKCPPPSRVTRIFLPWNIPTCTYWFPSLLRFSFPLVIQPAATYWAKSEGWEGGLSFPPSCHVIVNKPIKIIQKTESDKRRRKSTWNRYEIVLILMFSEVFYQSIFLAISNSFSSYEVIQIISELQLQTDTEGNRYRTFTQ